MNRVQFNNNQQKMINTIKDHKRQILIGLCLLGASALGAYYYFTNSKNKTPVKGERVKELTFDQKYAMIINDVQQILDQQKITGQFNNNLLFKIYRGQYMLANGEAKKQLLKCRKERRKFYDDRIQYAQIVTTSERQIQSILQKHLNAILARFSIDKSQWAEEVSKLYASSEEAREQWEEMIKDQDQKLILSLRDQYLKPLSFSDVKKILQFKMKKLQLLDIQDIALDIGVDETAKFTILQSYIRDQTFEEFGVEEELFSYSVSLLNPDQKQKLEDNYTQISMLMSNFIFDDVDIEAQRNESSYY